MELSGLTVEVSRHEAFAKQLEATHLGLDATLPMTTAPVAPEGPTEPPDYVRVSLRAWAPGVVSCEGRALRQVGITAEA